MGEELGMVYLTSGNVPSRNEIDLIFINEKLHLLP